VIDLWPGDIVRITQALDHLDVVGDIAVVHDIICAFGVLFVDLRPWIAEWPVPNLLLRPASVEVVAKLERTQS
jgi:hypothetical protein